MLDPVPIGGNRNGNRQFFQAGPDFGNRNGNSGYMTLTSIGTGNSEEEQDGITSWIVVGLPWIWIR